MAVKLIANYSKRLGLPGYSSHQFSVSVETELVATDDVAGESRRLYELLQSSVDQQIKTTGFVPPSTYGMEGQPDTPGHGNGRNGNNGSGRGGNHDDGSRAGGGNNNGGGNNGNRGNQGGGNNGGGGNHGGGKGGGRGGD